VKKSRLYWGFQKRGVVLGIILAIISTHPVSAQVLRGGGTYAQNFDLPANSGAANPRTDNVTLADTHSTFSTSFATWQQPFRVNPSLKGHTIVVF
jgi:hypothetical protein